VRKRTFFVTPNPTLVFTSVVLVIGAFLLLGVLPLFPSWPSSSWAAEPAAIEAQFLPYALGAPHITGLDPGVTLSRSNAHLAHEVVPEEILHLLEAGDLEITIQETTDLPPRQDYFNATIKNAGQASLNGGGTLHNYQAGAPFPLLDSTDPQAGEKLAWNFRYRDLGDTIQMVPLMQEVTPNGGVEHYNRGLMQMRMGMHRTDPATNEAQWEAQRIFMKTIFELVAPSDQEGISRILILHDDDNLPSEQWRYTPQNRRARKDYMNYLTPIGGYYEALQEENVPLFFQGYLRDYHWAFLGSKVMLVPGFLKTTEVRFGGKHNWYPQVPWELRRVLLLEGSPKISHPFGKRLYILDQQTYTPLLILTYTPAGAFLRLTITAHTHPNFHPGTNGLPIPAAVGAAWINYAKDRATLFTADDSLKYNRPLDARRFELMEILRRGK
jgi:hypothetical protein